MEQNTQAFKVLLNMMSKLRHIDTDMTLVGAMYLIEVMKDDGCRVADVIETLKADKSTISRAGVVLGSQGRQTKEGLGLIDVRNDPMDARSKRVYLTPKGKELAKSIKRSYDRLSKQ